MTYKGTKKATNKKVQIESCYAFGVYALRTPKLYDTLFMKGKEYL